MIFKQMNSLKSLYVAVLFAGFSYFTASAQENNSYFLHTIEKGQNLHSIASTYNVSTVDILKLNPGCNEKLHAGQTLRIPQKKKKKKKKKKNSKKKKIYKKTKHKKEYRKQNSQRQKYRTEHK
eukprot:TRINITY_DN18984_c0_g1_i2.p2 TRINITY_DN18984_c0_g1~~TRINITY_DN18984_c0_g1_i2.p2  ORF type:complete len:123 (-),score=27.52 TRINITY_DN18984_c0_g1_i2:14-382(-)